MNYNRVCCCSLAGTKACETCQYNGTTIESIQYSIDAHKEIRKYLDDLKESKAFNMNERDCDKCIFSTRSGGCVNWSCEFIDIREAEKAYKELHSKEGVE